MTPPPKKPIVTSERILALLFVALLGFFGQQNWPMVRTFIRTLRQDGPSSFPAATDALEQSYDEKFHMKEDFLDLNAIAHLAMGQNMMNEVVKDADGKLFFIADGLPSRTSTAAHLEPLITIFRQAQSNGIPFLAVQKPYKVIRGKTTLPAGVEDTTNLRYDLWIEIARQNGIPFLDLREAIYDQIEFYKTDHHWTVRTAFHAAKSVTDTLNQLYGLNLDPDRTLGSIDQFSSAFYPNSFLGSHGIRVGPVFTGKDDFEMLIPRFETQLQYRHFVAHQLKMEKHGSFSNALVNFPLLENPIYKNKYNACMQAGFAECIVENLKADNSLKVLFIADSFARPMMQYLSLYFGETRQLDPQSGRYTDSYLDYIQAYQPDIILVMYNGPIPL